MYFASLIENKQKHENAYKNMKFLIFSSQKGRYFYKKTLYLIYK